MILCSTSKYTIQNNSKTQVINPNLLYYFIEG